MADRMYLYKVDVTSTDGSIEATDGPGSATYTRSYKVIGPYLLKILEIALTLWEAEPFNTKGMIYEVTKLEATFVSELPLEAEALKEAVPQ